MTTSTLNNFNDPLYFSELKIKYINIYSARARTIQAMLLYQTMEEAIDNDLKLFAWWAWGYAKDIINDRWIEVEPFIMSIPEVSIEYASFIIGGRWYDAEPIIMKDAYQAYRYAFSHLGERWLEAEPYIRENPQVWSYYRDHFKIENSWL